MNNPESPENLKPKHKQTQDGRSKKINLASAQIAMILGSPRRRSIYRAILLRKLLGVKYGSRERAKEMRENNSDLEADSIIKKDVDRMENIYLTGVKESEYRTILFRLCHGVFVKDPSITYVQGFTYIASMFLLMFYKHRDPEESLYKTTYMLREFTKLFCRENGTNFPKTRGCGSLIAIVCDIFFGRNTIHNKYKVKSDKVGSSPKTAVSGFQKQTGVPAMASYEVNYSNFLPGFLACCVDAPCNIEAALRLFDIVICLGPCAPIYMYVAGILLNQIDYRLINDPEVGQSIKKMFNKKEYIDKFDGNYLDHVANLSLLLYIRIPLAEIDLNSYNVVVADVQTVLDPWGKNLAFGDSEDIEGLADRLPDVPSLKILKSKKDKGSRSVLFLSSMVLTVASLMFYFRKK